MNQFDAKMKELYAGFVYARFRKQEPRIATEDEIAEFEKELGNPLPPDYREFLRDYGGFSVHGYIDLPQPASEYLSVIFPGVHYGILPGDQYDVVRNYRYKKDTLPRGVIEIASSEPGYLCLATSGSESGSVYYWDSIGSVEEIVLIRLAASFSEYLNAMHLPQGFDPKLL